MAATKKKANRKTVGRKTVGRKTVGRKTAGTKTARKKTAGKKAAGTKAAGRKMTPVNPWPAYAEQLAREAQTTLRVMRAFPSDQSDFRPHERSKSALHLFHVFGVEQHAVLMALRGERSLAGALGIPVPGSLAEATDAFERVAASVVEAARAARPEAWHRTMVFFTAPQRTGDVPVGAIASMMLADQIHHRGQLSVYLRMAGGRVPSIYGPSADEPW